MLPPDGHVHSEWSWDAPAGSMEQTCARAVDLGLPSIAFTDHADFTPWTVSHGARLPARFRCEIPREGVFTPPALDVTGYLECLQRCRDRFPSPGSTPPSCWTCRCPGRLLEAWLRQASDEVLDELAEFAYGPDPDLGRVEDLIELIGRTAARLRPTMPSCEPREDR